MIMEEHLPLILVFIVIEVVCPSVIEFDQPIYASNGKVFFAPTELYRSYLTLFAVGKSLLDLLYYGLSLNDIGLLGQLLVGEQVKGD
jgi:hypothetical protein